MRAAQVRRIREDEHEKLSQLAAADNHIVLFPTHVVEKAGEIVGYLSIGAIPTVNLWMDSERVKASDSIAVLGQLDAIMDDSGIATYFMPCDEKSPYYRVMEKLGFEPIFKSVLHIKNLMRGK